MVTEPHFGPTLVGVAMMAVIAVGTSALVAAISAQRGTPRHRIIDWILVVWLVAAISAVAILTLQPGPGGLGSARPSIFNPLSRIDEWDAVANALLYVPVGLFAVLLLRSTPRMVAGATVLAFAISFTIESAQWVLPIDRAATTHDVVFNTLGGFAGAVLGSLVFRVVHNPKHAARPEGE